MRGLVAASSAALMKTLARGWLTMRVRAASGLLLLLFLCLTQLIRVERMSQQLIAFRPSPRAHPAAMSPAGPRSNLFAKEMQTAPRGTHAFTHLFYYYPLY